MTRRRLFQSQSALVPLFLFVACSGFGACNGEIAFDPPPDLDPNETVADLTDAEATQLCAWIEAIYPSSCTNRQDAYVGAPGYVSGGCAFGVTCDNRPVILDFLTPDNCVLNLRHSPCQGTVSALEVCMSSAVAAIESSLANLSSDSDQCDAAGNAACAAFWAAADCDETVIQASPRLYTVPFEDVDGCSGLPVVPGDTCPPTIGEPVGDGGTYSLPDGCGPVLTDPCPPALLPDGALYSPPDAQGPD
jgi:hypothetical protein